MNKEKNVVICGNGPSMKEVDYSLLPEEFDVFRTNQFYFETEYFMGKKVSKAFFNPSSIFEQLYTVIQLRERGEYDIDDVVVTRLGFNFLSRLRHDDFDTFFGTLVKDDCFEKIRSLEKFFNFLVYNEIYNNVRFTSGTALVAYAIALGYTNIFICGVDFYRTDGESEYCFSKTNSNILQIYPAFSSHSSHSVSHDMNFDLKCLHFLKENYAINIYSLVRGSLVECEFGLSKEQTSTHLALRTQKPEGFIDDILIPSKQARSKFHKHFMDVAYQEISITRKEIDKHFKKRFRHKVKREIKRIFSHITKLFKFSKKDKK